MQSLECEEFLAGDCFGLGAAGGDALAVDPDSSMPKFFCLFEAQSFRPAGVISAQTHVEMVLRKRCRSQILKTIVVLVAIDMI